MHVTFVGVTFDSNISHVRCLHLVIRILYRQCEPLLALDTCIYIPYVYIIGFFTVTVNFLKSISYVCHSFQGRQGGSTVIPVLYAL